MAGFWMHMNFIVNKNVHQRSGITALTLSYAMNASFSDLL